MKALADETMLSLSSARQSEVKAWEEEFEPCEHTLLLQQTSVGAIPASGLAHCANCELTSNLWLCLTCGSLGCGRVQYGGVTGGNGHGLRHFEETGHPVSVKLGTITPEGGAGKFVSLSNEFSPHFLVRHLLLRVQRPQARPCTLRAPCCVWY